MSKVSTRRISTELQGDQAVVVDTTIATLQLKTGTKKEIDSQLISLALDALEKTISDCSKATGKRFPDANDVKAYLKGEATA